MGLFGRSKKCPFCHGTGRISRTLTTTDQGTDFYVTKTVPEVRTGPGGKRVTVMVPKRELVRGAPRAKFSSSMGTCPICGGSGKIR